MNILISFLGTGQPKDGKYLTANYVYNAQEYQSAFIAESLHHFFNYNKIILVGTCKSMWENAYMVFVKHTNSETENRLFDLRVADETQTEVLQSALDEAFENAVVQAVIVENGVNEAEMHANLMALTNVLSTIEASNIDLDITHSFRSLPFFVNPSLSFYTAYNNKTKLGNIWYGMYELSRDNNGKSPVVNLNPSKELNELFRCTRSFLDFGNAFPLIAHLRQSALVHDDTVKPLDRLSKAISLGNANDVLIYARKFDEAVSKNSWQGHLAVIQKEIQKGFKEIIAINEHNQKHEGLVAVAKWYKNNNMLLHAGIVAVEAIRSFIIQEKNIVANSGLTNEAEIYRSLTDKFNSHIKGKNKGIYEKYINLNKIRIRLAHAGTEKPNASLNDWENLNNYLNYATDLNNYRF